MGIGLEIEIEIEIETRPSYVFRVGSWPFLSTPWSLPVVPPPSVDFEDCAGMLAALGGDSYMATPAVAEARPLLQAPALLSSSTFTPPYSHYASSGTFDGFL
jgi:hypothetical protein